MSFLSVNIALRYGYCNVERKASLPVGLDHNDVYIIMKSKSKENIICCLVKKPLMRIEKSI